MAHDINFVPPRNAIVVAGSKWEDDTITDIDYTSSENAGDSNLDAGEELTAAEIVSNQDNESIAARALATTLHPHDFDSDGQEENAVEYRYEVKPNSTNDKYNALPGLSSTLPFGSMGDPGEIIPGSYVGPVAAFRVIIRNRTDGTANPLTLSVDNIGCHIHARVLRNTPPSDTIHEGDLGSTVDTGGN